MSMVSGFLSEFARRAGGVNRMQNTIGVLGGMGSYATLFIFERLLETFPVQKEWERPRIMIDNYCTLPSRVRAVLYQENVEELLEGMITALKGLEASGCSRIFMGCNTAHSFFDEILKRAPSLKDKMINIIDSTCHSSCKDGFKRVAVIASEGTVKSKIYQNMLGQKGLDYVSAGEPLIMRQWIEAVKTNCISTDILAAFDQFIIETLEENDALILGCTEFSVLYRKLASESDNKRVIDPVSCVCRQLQDEFSNKYEIKDKKAEPNYDRK